MVLFFYCYLCLWLSFLCLYLDNNFLICFLLYAQLRILFYDKTGFMFWTVVIVFRQIKGNSFWFYYCYKIIVFKDQFHCYNEIVLAWFHVLVCMNYFHVLFGGLVKRLFRVNMLIHVPIFTSLSSPISGDISWCINWFYIFLFEPFCIIICKQVFTVHIFPFTICKW